MTPTGDADALAGSGDPGAESGVEPLGEQPAEPTAAHANAAMSRRARGLISASTATPRLVHRLLRSCRPRLVRMPGAHTLAREQLVVAPDALIRTSTESAGTWWATTVPSPSSVVTR